MKQILIVFFVGLFNLGYSQSFPELEKVLIKELPESLIEDGQWVFNASEADIKKIDKPHLKTLVPHFDFYRVTLTNFLGYHVNQATCVILFDSAASKIVLVEPIWYGVSSQLIKIFINEKFDKEDDIRTCLREIHQLMELNPRYKFIETGVTSNLITYDLIYFKEGTYIKEGSDKISTVNYTSDNIWRKIEVVIKKLKIKKYITINLRLKDDKEHRKEYKRIIH